MAPAPTVADVVAVLERRYVPAWAEDWDRVGLVLGEPEVPVTRVLCVIDCVPETVEEAIAVDAGLIIAHHPLLLRGVTSVAPTAYKGRVVHQLIRAGIGLYTVHTNADVANPGVSDALAARLDQRDPRPLHLAAGPAAGGGRGFGRVGRLREARSLASFVSAVTRALPSTAWGVRAAGDPDRRIETVAVCGGAGEAFLPDAAAAGVDVYLTSDLRHHPASEHVSGDGPALVDAAHWATERPWLDSLASALRTELSVAAIVSDVNTDPWTLQAR